MTTPTQGQVRAWARAQGMTVNDRGSLPVKAVQAYVAAHSTNKKGTTVTSPARKRVSRVTSKAAAKSSPRRSPAKTTRRTARPVAAKRPAAAAVATPAGEPTAPPAGTVDLAGGLRTYLGAIDTEVRAVSALSERIDALVKELNDARDQQAKRLAVLDELRVSVTDQSLGSFLDQAIKPRKTRVAEVVPERLV